MSEITPEKPVHRLPADYYSEPVSQRRIFPRWVTLGCGTVALVILIVLFAGGAWINSGGAPRLVHWFFGTMQSELFAACDRDVRSEQKTGFAAEMSALQERIIAGKANSDRVVEFLQAMRDDQADGHVSSAELEQLTKKLHEANTTR